MSEHVATMTPSRPKTKGRCVEIAVRCSCGARALLGVFACEMPETCTGTTHIRSGSSKGGVCPAVVAVIRCCDSSLTRAQAEGIARDGPQGAAA